MADTKTPLIQLDTGKAITSLKEFKQYLDDLKGALLGLEKGSEEYNKVAKDLRDGQQKLNDVMYEARKNSEAAEGSYDALVAKMRDLRKEWRATTDDMKRQDIGKQILDINNQLKDLDASTGNFQRNVGDYKNAFADAFDKMLGPLGKVGGSLGTLARDVKGMIPLIKSVNTTATAGLKGIKAAIASTGIGLLIVAVGELAANWEKVTDWIKKAVIAQDDYIRALKDTETRLNALILKNAEYSKDWDAVEKQRKTLFEGYTEVTFAQERFDKALEAQKNAIQENEKATKEWKNAWTELNKAEEDAKNARSDGEIWEASQRLTKAKEAATQATIDYGLAQKNLQVANEGVRVSTQNLANVKKQEENATKSNASAHKTAKATYEGEKQAIEDLIRRLERYRRYIEPNAKWIVQKTDLEEELQRDLKLIDDAERKGVEIVGGAEALKLRVREMYKEKNKDIRREEGKDRADEILQGTNEVIKNLENELSRNLKDYNLMDKLLGYEGAPSTDSKFKKFADGIKDSFNNIFGTQSTIFEEFQAKTEKVNDVYEINKQSAEERLKTYEETIKRYEQLQAEEEQYAAEAAARGEDYQIVFDYTLSDEYIQAVEERDNIKMELDDLYTQNVIDNLEIQDERDEELAKAKAARMQLIGTSITATSNLLTQFASLQEQQIKDDVANGKISEKEANKKFKRVKMLQKAAAIMETAQAAMGAYSSLASIPYVGPALGIAAAAAAVAQGMMQIKQIDKTTLSSSNSSGLSTATPDMNTVTNTYEPTYVTNMQSNTELSELANVVGSVQPVVRVTDIEDTQNTVKVRDEESSY